MGWKRGLLGIATGGLSGFFTNDKSNKKDPLAALTAQLQPLIDSNKKLADYGITSGTADFNKASANYDEALNFLHTILHGSNDDILKTLDASEITKSFDDQEQNLSQSLVRGGRRASTLGSLGFERQAAINRIVSQIRSQAPERIANIAQAIANMGGAKFSAAAGATASASNILFGLEDINQREKDRRAELIAGILGAAGSVAGAVACVTLDTFVDWFNPKMRRIESRKIGELGKGDRVFSIFSKVETAILDIIEMRDAENQKVMIFETNGGRKLICTPSHAFLNYGHENNERNAEDYKIGDSFLVWEDNTLKNDEIKNISRNISNQTVRIIKLHSKNKNFNFVTNGIFSVDDFKEVEV